MLCTKWDVNKLIRKLLQDPERLNGVVDHDFEMKKQLTKEQIDFINSQIKGKVAYKLTSSEYSLPYAQEEGYETPYFVNTENILGLYNIGDFVYFPVYDEDNIKTYYYGKIEDIKYIPEPAYSNEPMTLVTIKVMYSEDGCDLSVADIKKVVQLEQLEDGEIAMERHVRYLNEQLENFKNIRKELPNG